MSNDTATCIAAGPADLVRAITTASSRLCETIRKSEMLSGAYDHAQKAERRARNLRRRGNIHAAKVWERHAQNCRNVAGRIRFGGAACTP